MSSASRQLRDRREENAMVVEYLRRALLRAVDHNDAIDVGEIIVKKAREGQVWAVQLFVQLLTVDGQGR